MLTLPLETLIRLGLTLCDELDEIFLVMLERLDYIESKKEKPFSKRVQLIKLLQGIGCSNDNIYEILNFIHFKSLFQQGAIKGYEEKEARVFESAMKDSKRRRAESKKHRKETMEALKKLQEDT